ncbi:protein-export chaperone SecB [Fervidobacterium sp.]
MKTNIPKSSIFQLVKYQIVDAKFQVKESEDKKIDYKINIVPSLEIKETEEKNYLGRVKLQIDITGKVRNKIVRKVSVLIVGEFKGEDVDEKNFENLCKINGVANLLLIARAFIASVTSQITYPPMVLPLFDLKSWQK